MTARKNLLVIMPPHLGGRAVGARLAAAFAPRTGDDIAVVESAEEDMRLLARAQVIVSSLAPVDAAAIASAPALEFIQCASHGFEYIDVDAARARGITVCGIGSSGAEDQAVAEHTFALMLALAKRLVPAHNALQQGSWAEQGLRRSLTELSGKTLGLVGFGAIGRQVAVRAGAFGMRTLYCSRSDHADAARRYGARRVPLELLLRRSDVVSLHLPLSAETRHLLDARRLAWMKPSAFVINTARGGLIDQEALADALEAGRLAGAGLDVFAPEPPPASLRLLRAPGVVLSPHVAGVTRETVVRITLAALDNVCAFLDGEPVRDVVNGR